MKKFLALVLTCVGVFATDIISVDNGGRWVVMSDKDVITDKKQVVLILTASSAAGRSYDEMGLVIKCDNDKTDMFVNWGNPPLEGKIDITDRIDNEKPAKSDWTLSNNGTMTFKKDPIPFLKRLLKAKKYSARIAPSNDVPITVIFETEGLDNAIKELREACRW